MTLSLDDYFSLFDTTNHWICLIDTYSESVECNELFRKIVDAQIKHFSFQDWLLLFVQEDQSSLSMALEVRDVSKKVTVRLDQEFPLSISGTVKEIRKGTFAFIGELSSTDKYVPTVGSVKPVNHFLTWLTLINDRLKNDSDLGSGNHHSFISKDIYVEIKEIIENVPYGFAVIDNDWNISYMNPIMEEIFGISLTSVHGTSLWDTFNKDNYRILYNQLTNAIHTKEIASFKVCLYKVKKFVNVTAYPKNEQLYLFIQDVTEVENYTKALKETEERFSLLAENISDVFWIVSPEFTSHEYMSPTFEDVFGLSILDVQRDHSLWSSRIHVEDRKKMSEAFKQMKYVKNSVEYRYQLPTGEWKWIRSKGYPLQKLHNSVIVGVHEDITELKEKYELQTQYKQNETVLRVAAGIAHEIKNPLTSIKGFMQLMDLEKKDNKRYSDIIFSELTRIETIVNEFMLLAKPKEDNILRETSILDILSYVKSLFSNQISQQNVIVREHIDENFPTIVSDEKRLKQIFINLVKNALEAMDDGGEIVISMTYHEADHQVRCTVKDNGKGIEKDQLKRIGQPFFTTKEKGTGLGVMVTNKFVESLGGTIRYESEIGKGTSVTIALPANQE